MSVDHKPTDLPELERIKRAGGQVGVDARVNGGLNLSRAIGKCSKIYMMLGGEGMIRFNNITTGRFYTSFKLLS